MPVTPTPSIVMPISGTRKKKAATEKAVERKTGQYASDDQRSPAAATAVLAVFDGTIAHD
jgi:hypothetical protein